jgi:hypothetical protein
MSTLTQIIFLGRKEKEFEKHWSEVLVRIPEGKITILK